MECLRCPISHVCIVSENMRHAMAYATVSLTNCKIKEQLTLGFETKKTESVPIQYDEPMPFDIRPRKDFREESNKIRQERDEKSEPELTVTVCEEVIPIECPTCKGSTSLDDIKLCHECSKEICSNCATESLKHLNFCPECWDKQ